MRHMNVNRAVRGGGSTFLRGKRRKSATTASLGFKGSCDYCNKPVHKNAQCFNFLRESGRGSLPLRGAARRS